MDIATLVQQQHQTLEGNHNQGQKEQDNVNTVASAEGHAVDRFRGEAGCSAKEIAVVAPDNDSVGDSSTQCSDVIDDDNEEEETDVEESGAGGWIMNPPVSTIIQHHQAFYTTNGYIALPNPDSSNFSDVRVKDSSNVHLGNEVNYNGPVTINQFVYTNSTPNQDAIELDVIRPSENISNLSTNKDNGAPNGCIFPQYTELNKVTQWLWTWKRAVLSCVITLILLAIVVPITVHFTHQPDASVSPKIPTSSTEGTRPAPQSQSPTRTNNTVGLLKLDGSREAVARANFDIIVVIDGTPYIVNTVESSQNCTTASTTWIFENGNRRQVCSRQLIFEDNFDNLNATKWNQLNRFAGPPDYEIVVYMTDEVTDTSDGQLRIKPILMLNTKYGTNFVSRGTLKIENCTGKIGTAECYRKAAGFYILPPVISGRINTKGKFEFLFGRVEIRAKLPHGDWVYPVITLESAENTWQLGLHHEIRIASSVGNEELRTPEGETISGHILAAGGLTVSLNESNAQSNNRMTLPKTQSGKTWSDDFHIFEIEWKSGLIVVKVDGVQYGEQPVDGSFGKPSYLTLGVAVGGLHEFQDHVTSNGYAKPWRNAEAKTFYKFYHAKNHWHPTWDTRTALQVDYVKVSQNCTTASTTWIFENGNRRQACSRQLIFEDNFDNLNATKWNQLNRFAGPPDYEFVVYMTDEVTDTSDGQLRIKPILLNTKYGTNFVLRGTLKIENCTGEIGTVECYQVAAGFYIFPPLISGRINTKGKFEFLFGRVEIRAKLPHGDWVYPVITLESAENTWQLGLHHEIRIASSVGNEELRTPEGETISGHILAAGGLTVSLNESNAQSNNRMTLPKRQSGKTWSDDFHIFEIEWKSGLIVVKVDGVQYGEQAVGRSFGKPSYLTLGVAIGGLHEFQDHVTSNGYAKPWRNVEAKALYNFYHAKNYWHPTWDTRTALQVDYVKVWAF
ncbi:uncharacterized protein [Temnothorax nylanderi]|uniref:uncharacterized protein isoform X2 n=1 Tax=Temnothorax nylanderi TaxID=102681 RepID=UPI003A89ABF3